MLKKNKKVISKIITTAMLVTSITSIYATNINANADVALRKIAGDDRYKTAVEISKSYDVQRSHAVIVNGQKGIVDALTATPYASLKNASILITQNNKLNPDTKKELERMGVTTVDIVGGTASVSDDVKAEIEAMGITVKRIAGNSKYETALKIAKEIDKISNISNIAVASGEVLADAVSVAAPAGVNKMPIILAHPKNGLDSQTKEFIEQKEISTSYIIGGENSVSQQTENSLPGTKKRLQGLGRQDTNAAVIKEFYPQEYVGKVYITKSGQVNNPDEIVDALAVGVLAAHYNNPVVMVGNSLSKTQKNVLDGKLFYIAEEVGNGIPKNSVNSVIETQNPIKTVTTVEDLNNALINAKNGYTVNFKLSEPISSTININSTKEITVNIDNLDSNDISVNMPKGTLNINNSVLNKVSVEALKNITVGKETTINDILINKTSKNMDIVNNGQVTNIDALATGIIISGSGQIDKLIHQVDTDLSNYKGNIENIIPASLNLNIEDNQTAEVNTNEYIINIADEEGLEDNDKKFKQTSLLTSNFKLFTVDGREMSGEPKVRFIDDVARNQILISLENCQVESTGEARLKIEGLEVETGKLSKYREEVINVHDNYAPVLENGEFITIKDKIHPDKPVIGYELKLAFNDEILLLGEHKNIEILLRDVEIKTNNTKYDGYITQDKNKIYDDATYRLDGRVVTVSIPKDSIKNTENWNEVFENNLSTSLETINPMSLVKDADFIIDDNGEISYLGAQEGIKIDLKKKIEER